MGLDSPSFNNTWHFLPVLYLFALVGLDLILETKFPTFHFKPLPQLYLKPNPNKEQMFIFPQQWNSGAKLARSTA